MSTITYGSESVFEEATTYYISAAMLDPSHVVTVYRSSDTYGYACIGSISGTTITWGTPVVFNSANTTDMSVAKLDSTHFVVAYRDFANSSYGTAIVGVTNGGTTISSYGAENVFNSATTEKPAVAALDSAHFVVAYGDGGNSYHGTAIIGVVSGTTISSYGAENVYISASSSYISVSSLDSTHFVVAYQTGADYGSARIGLTNGGTTISSYGTENVFNSAITNYIGVAALDSTHFVVSYEDDGGSDYGIARVGVISGTTISSYGAENTFNVAATQYTSVAKLDSTHFVVAYQDDGGDDYGCARIGTVSGTTISEYNDEAIFSSSSTDWISVVALSSSKFAAVYRDLGNSFYGTGIVGTTAVTGPFPVFFRP